MRFQPMTIPGVVLVHLEKQEDERGSFARAWCQEEFARQGLNAALVQCNVSFNRHRGTLRGLHYQAPPHEEAKLVRVMHGAILDVVVDLRPWSPAYLHWIAVPLDAETGQALYVPEGCAHGFQTLIDRTSLFYQMSAPYVADAARGLRWDDPALGIVWPISPPILSDRDRSYPDFLGERRLTCL